MILFESRWEGHPRDVLTNHSRTGTFRELLANTLRSLHLATSTTALTVAEHHVERERRDRRERHARVQMMLAARGIPNALRAPKGSR